MPQSNAFSAASESLSKTVFGNSNAQRIKISPQKKMNFMQARDVPPKKFDISQCKLPSTGARSVDASLEVKRSLRRSLEPKIHVMPQIDQSTMSVSPTRTDGSMTVQQKPFVFPNKSLSKKKATLTSSLVEAPVTASGNTAVGFSPRVQAGDMLIQKLRLKQDRLIQPTPHADVIEEGSNLGFTLPRDSSGSFKDISNKFKHQKSRNLGQNTGENINHSFSDSHTTKSLNKSLGICSSIVPKAKVTMRNLLSNKKSSKGLTLTTIGEKTTPSTPPKQKKLKQKSTCKKKVKKENMMKTTMQVKPVGSQRATQLVGQWLNQTMKPPQPTIAVGPGKKSQSKSIDQKVRVEKQLNRQSSNKIVIEPMSEKITNMALGSFNPKRYVMKVFSSTTSLHGTGTSKTSKRKLARKLLK